jgi:hypothetical protein
MSAADASSAHQGSFDKLILLLLCAVSAGLFYSVGWMVVRPVDPFGAVSLLNTASPVVALAELCGLAAVVAGLAAVLLRGRLPYAGTFVVAVGLAVMATRGSSADHLVRFPPAGTSRSVLFALLAAEVVAWAVVIAVGVVAARMVDTWLGVDAGDAPRSTQTPPARAEQTPISGRGVGSGLLLLLLCAVCAALLIRTMGGSLVTAIHKGQVYFSLSAGFYLATLLSVTVSRTRLIIWPLLAVVLISLLGYLAGSQWPTPTVVNDYRQLTHIMPNFACRALPVEYLSAGVAGAIAGTWTGARMAMASVD